MRFKLIISALLLLAAADVFGHPEDELCVPGQDGMDPALCAALAEMNSAEGALNQTDLAPILDASGKERSFLSTAALYVTIGIGHILPDGADHILFVLAIFLASVRLKALIWQISAFTVAHTATLALAASGVITPSSAVVEPLIAFTIAFVAIENLVFNDMTRWRPLVVFGFGLIHGLGFAGFFGELGLPPGQFWSALIGFNVGVEIGQLSVIIVAAILGILLRRWLQDPNGLHRYRSWIARPGSLLIGLTGLWWGVTRLLA
ncbi:MAG: HupE/UreJ family protein [Gammaproteobacteria bacterium]|nr:HupE/UreJ family protein [Gammaproteobacteria bacterium]